jgi:pilus assembly protein CpaE
VKDFCEGLELDPTVVIQFDGESFGHAANNGQMLEELNATSEIVEQIHELSLILTHRQEFAPSSKPKGSALAPLLSKLPFKL